MKKQYCFLAAMMLWMFSSVSFASMTEMMVNPGPLVTLDFKDPNSGKILFTETGLTQQTAFRIADDWFRLSLGHFGDGGSFGDDFGHEHHGHHGHHEPDGDEGPAAVPLPSALWLFGSALLGLLGVKRKPSEFLG
jgi:hypothetical protein